MSLFHRHDWNVEGAYTFRHGGTHLTLQCKTCAEPRKTRIASFAMTGEQISKFVKVRYGQASDFIPREGATK